MLISEYSSKLRKLISLAKVIYLPAVIFFIAYLGWNNRTIINDIFNDIDLAYLSICVMIWLCLHCLSPLFTTISFKQLGISLSYKDAYFIHTTYLPAKYLPGGIWHTVARGQMYCNHNISKDKVFAYLLHENLLIAAVTLTIGGFIVGVFSDNTKISNLAFCLSAFSFTILIAWPIVRKRFFRKQFIDLGIYHYVNCMLIISLYWLIASVSFVIFLDIFPSIDSACHSIFTAGTYIFSWGIGFIAIFAPQGFGISESVAAGLLCITVTPAALIVFLSSFRIIILFADLLAWATSKCIPHKE